jgi:hypothetical protein
VFYVEYVGSETDEEYWLRRAAEQRARGDAAGDEQSRNLHEQLARAYEKAATQRPE